MAFLSPTLYLLILFPTFIFLIALLVALQTVAQGPLELAELSAYNADALVSLNYLSK